MENNMKRKPKYNVGDKVIYLDLQKICDVATITEIELMEEYEWNKEAKFLYSLKEYPYLRYEEEIVGLYEK